MAVKKARCRSVLATGTISSPPFNFSLELDQDYIKFRQKWYLKATKLYCIANVTPLQTVDVILAWLAAEDIGAKKKIQALLADRDETFQVVKTSLQRSFPPLSPYLSYNLSFLYHTIARELMFRTEQLDSMNASEEDEDSVLKDMLTTLLQHL